MILETERLILREMESSDAEDMLRLHSHPEVQLHTGEQMIVTFEGIQDKIKQKTDEYRKYGYGRWVTVLKEGMQFVGWAGLAYLPEFDEVDIGYRFLPEFWGQGLATEASFAILKYGFDQLKLERIVAMAMEENKGSIRVMEKVGMHFEKLAPYQPGSIDVVWYSINREEHEKRAEQ